MKYHLTFHKGYFIAFVLIFATEVLIAIFLKDGFIRHSFGDYLAIILVYCFFKTFIKENCTQIAVVSLIIAFTIEFLQLTNFLELFNLQDIALARIVLGSTFSVSDLIAYALGFITILIYERYGNS
ncbi:MAG: DUF2809 domain-containing protein [Aquaticitalea sp.]